MEGTPWSCVVNPSPLSTSSQAELCAGERVVLSFTASFQWLILVTRLALKARDLSSSPASLSKPHSGVDSKVKQSEVAQSCLTLCDPWTVAYQASPSMGFSRQEYRSGLPFPSPDLPNPEIKPRSPALQVNSLPAEPQVIAI